MPNITLPLCQKRLTNVAIVRLKSQGKRFEIACYKNKVVNWRDGVEKDLQEVIQIETIFENVSKGIVAKDKDLQQVFGTVKYEDICRIILKTGELQVSEKEREVKLEGLFRDIVQIVAERCIHTPSGRQHTTAAVESALRSAGFSVLPDHSAKKQALKAIELLCTEMPESFARAQMRLRIRCQAASHEEVKKHLVEAIKAAIEEEGPGENGAYVFTFTCDPREYRVLDAFTAALGNASLEIVTAAVVAEGVSVNGNSTGFGVSAAAVGIGRAATQACGGYSGVTVPTSSPAAVVTSIGVAGRKAPRCSSCAADFEDAGQYRTHCRSNWHNFNLKRKVKGLLPVSEEDFLEIGLDAREGFLGVD